MIERLVHALIASRNEAADDLLLEALDLGNETEKHLALGALVKRGTVRGLGGVIDRYARLPDRLKLAVLEHVRGPFGPALSECGRSGDVERRLAAMRLIALGRHGRLGHVLLENLGDGEDRLSRGAVEAIVALARWVAAETRLLQRQAVAAGSEFAEAARYRLLVGQRPEVEDLVCRALERQKGAFGGELTRAALLLADHPASRTFDVLRSARHPGRGPMERRLQQPPASEHVDAFLAGAANVVGLRPPFAGTFAHVYERPVMDALLRRTHWLKDGKVAACVGDVMGGRWMDDVSLAKDLARRPPGDAGAVAEWVAASGCAEVVKDRLLGRVLERGTDDVGVRLRVLRAAMARPRGASVQVVREMLHDPDERVRRMAAREIARRRPVGYQGMLMAAMGGAAPSVRRVIGRAVGESGFQAFWRRYDRLDERTRRTAGRAVLKVVPDAARRLAALLTSGPTGQRLRAMQLSQEGRLVEDLREVVLRLGDDADARVRSKAVMTMRELTPVPADLLVDRVLRDADARVRANAIEVLELAREMRLVPVLADRVRAENNRERANAIKALHTMAPASASGALGEMLRDPRANHRVSALWALRQVRNWQRLPEVGRLAKGDPEGSVRRYALGVLKHAAVEIRGEQEAVA